MCRCRASRAGAGRSLLLRGVVAVLAGTTASALTRPAAPVAAPRTRANGELNFREGTLVIPRDDQQASVERSVRRFQRDLDAVDDDADSRASILRGEGAALGAAVAVAAAAWSAPGAVVVGCAALTAAVGGYEEWQGAAAAANAHEISALATTAAAEAEAILAGAERTKSVLPVCVVAGATMTSFALLAKAESGFGGRMAADVEDFLLLACPVISILAASVAVLAAQQSSRECARAQNLGRRRFATKRDVGLTWRSVPEQVAAADAAATEDWLGFALGVVPAPTVAAALLATENFDAALISVVATATAAAQAAYHLAFSEYALARATESVAAKSRTAALAEAYAEQARAANAPVPYASSLAALAAAGAALVVEAGPRGVARAAPLASAYAVRTAAKYRARARGDAAATGAAADQLAGLDDGADDDPNIIAKLTWRNFVATLGASRRAVFAAIDSDGDGRLSAEEVAAYAKRGFRKSGSV